METLSSCTVAFSQVTVSFSAETARPTAVLDQRLWHTTLPGHLLGWAGMLCAYRWPVDTVDQKSCMAALLHGRPLGSPDRQLPASFAGCVEEAHSRARAQQALAACTPRPGKQAALRDVHGVTELGTADLPAFILSTHCVAWPGPCTSSATRCAAPL